MGDVRNQTLTGVLDFDEIDVMSCNMYLQKVVRPYSRLKGVVWYLPLSSTP